MKFTAVQKPATNKHDVSDVTGVSLCLFIMASDAPESGWLSNTCKRLIGHGPRQWQAASLAEGPDRGSQSRAIGSWVKMSGH